MSTRSGAARSMTLAAASAASQHSVALRTELQAVERTLVLQPIEHVYVLDAAGRRILVKAGVVNHVPLSDADLALMPGNILTHNHPTTGGSFSDADVSVILRSGLAEIRAVGSRYRYSLRPPLNGWDLSEPMNPLALYALLKRPEYLRGAAEIRAGKLTIDDANLNIDHNIWTQVAAVNGMRYERTAWKRRSRH